MLKKGEGAPNTPLDATTKAKKALLPVKTAIKNKKRLPKNSEAKQPRGRPPHMRGVQCIWDRQAACWRDAKTGAKRRE